jgi:Flp pilus assembly protein TadG
MQKKVSLFDERAKALSADDRGSIALLFAACLLVMVGAAGMAIDLSRANAAKTNMQSALDIAVLAAATTDAPDIVKATAIFNQNVLSVEADKVVPKFTVGSDGRVIGSVTADVQTTLMGIFNVKSLAVSASSAAIGTKSGGACVIALSSSANQSLLVNSGADVVAPECEVHVRSTANPAAIFNAGTKLDTKRICIAGSKIIDNGGSHPNLEKSCAAQSDPYAGVFPEPYSSSCTYSHGNYNGGSVTLNPGVYCGWFNFNGAPTVTFNPGTYILKSGGWNVNGGTWTGHGVTFYFADKSKIQFNSAVAATLSAPSSGTYRGLVIFEKAGLGKSQMVFNDAKGMNLEGIVYLPSRDVTFNGGSQLTSKSMMLVTNTLLLNQTKWKLKPHSAAGSGGGAVTGVRLIE